VHDLRATRGSSLMRILHIVSDLFPATVSNCLVQEVPHLEHLTMADDQSIDMRASCHTIDFQCSETAE
jgi:hypothetical protein